MGEDKPIKPFEYNHNLEVTVAELRGKVIHQIVLIENLLDVIISNYFCDEFCNRFFV